MIHFKKFNRTKSVSVSILALTAFAGNAWSDQVILDDLIVAGSTCVGFDCVNGESFGFDTIRLKENNLRIRFTDTSTSASFPTRDWQLTANDTSNGGANKFSIDDIDGGRTPFTIEAGAPSHSLYVEDGGRIGIGTSTPVVGVHHRNGNTPTLRLDQDGSSGFAAQTWDVAGNEANFFIRDASNGSTLPFRIRPGAPTSSLDIQPDGHVSINKNISIGNGTNISNPNYDISIRKENTGINGGLHLVAFADGKEMWRANGTDDELDLHSDDLVIKSNGDVGVGTMTPSSKFHVNGGDIRVSGGSFIDDGTNLNVPDYVFAPEYSLMPLNELKAFIEKEKHLPAIPSAETVAASGLNLSEFQMKLLEKVEQLTLYTLEQEDTIQTLNARLHRLEGVK